MKTAIIAIKNKSEENFLRTFFRRAGIKAHMLKQQDAEDAIFAALIDAGMKTKGVSEELVMKALGKK